MSYKSNYVIGVVVIAILSFLLWIVFPSNVPGSPIPRVAVILSAGLVVWTFTDAFLVTVSRAQKQFGKLSYNQAKAMGGWTGGVLKVVIQARLFDSTEDKKVSDLVFWLSIILVFITSVLFGPVLAPIWNGQNGPVSLKYP